MAVGSDIGQRKIHQIRLSDGEMRVDLLSYGAITQGWWLGNTALTLGQDNSSNYLGDPAYMGAIIGPVANRIAGACYRDGTKLIQFQPNEGDNLLHGGALALSARHWDLVQLSRNEAEWTVTLPGNLDGFPAKVHFRVHVRLTQPRLIYMMTALPDQSVAISMTQHNYYTLGTSPGSLRNQLRVAANHVLGLDGNKLPTGEILPAGSHGLDFRSAQTLDQRCMSLDHYFIFDPDRNRAAPVAELRAPSGLGLLVYSDQPGAQVYAGGALSAPFAPLSGICIEPSGYPDAVNHPSFPSIEHTPDRPYRQVLTLEIVEGMA